MNVAATRKARIDQMLKDGKITPEQHEELLGSLNESSARQESSPAPEEVKAEQAQKKKSLDLTPGPFLIGGSAWILVILTGVIATSLTVLPRFEEIYTSLGAQLPLLTQGLIMASQFTLHGWILSVPLLILFVAGFWFLDCLRNTYRDWKGWRSWLVAFFLFLVLSIPVLIACIALVLYLPMFKIGEVIK